MRSTASLVIVLVVASAMGLGAIVLRPDQSMGDGFLFSDQGNNLYLAEALSDGARVYSEAFTLYGPLPAWLYRGASGIVGNTPLTYQTLNVLFSVASLALLCWTLGRLGSPLWAAVWSLVALLPSMLAPGSLLGGLTVSTYLGLERLVICGVVFLWRPPAARTAWRSFVVGGLAGGLIWVRFGTTALVLCGVLVADLVRGDRRWAATGRAMAGAAVAVAAFVAWAFALYPRAMAIDIVWPSYLIQSYSWVTPDERWPAFSWRLLFAQYGPAAAGFGLVVAAVIKRKTSVAVSLSLMVTAIYVAGLASTFRHAHHFRQFAWLLALGGGLAALSIRTRWRVAAVTMAVPALLVIGKNLMSAPSPVVRLETPAAGTLYLSAEGAARAEALARYAAGQGRGEKLLVGPSAAGWHSAFGVPISGRHSWFLNGFIRPFEYDDVVSQFAELSAVIVCPGAPAPWSGLNLPSPVLARIAPLFEPRGKVADCDLLVRR